MAADQDLERGWAAAMAAPRSAHLSDELWERMFSAELQDPVRADAFEHVSECAQCAAVYRGLSQMRAGARAFDAGVPAAPGLAPRAPLWGWMGAAAAALLAVLVGLNGHRLGTAPSPAPTRTDELRSGGSAVPLPLAPRGLLAAVPTSFRWDPAEGLGAYRVELLSAAGLKLWSSEIVSSPSVAWPSDQRLEAGRYYWRVVATATPTSPPADGVMSPLVQIDLPASFPP